MMVAPTGTPTPNDPTFKTVDLGAEVIRMWGAEWNKPEIAYEFSNGKKFELRTGDAAIYASSPKF